MDNTNVMPTDLPVLSAQDKKAAEILDDEFSDFGLVVPTINPAFDPLQVGLGIDPTMEDQSGLLDGEDGDGLQVDNVFEAVNRCENDNEDEQHEILLRFRMYKPYSKDLQAFQIENIKKQQQELRDAEIKEHQQQNNNNTNNNNTTTTTTSAPTVAAYIPKYDTLKQPKYLPKISMQDFDTIQHSALAVLDQTADFESESFINDTPLVIQPTHDLKRDIRGQMEYLDKKTEESIAKLMQKRLLGDKVNKFNQDNAF